MPTGIYKHHSNQGFQKGYIQTKKHRENLSNALIGRIPWNKDKKGLQTAWNKGKKCPSISKARKGIKFSETHRKNLGSSHIGKQGYWLGKKRPDIAGKNCYNWKDGKSFEPYGLKFNNQLKEQIRQRDNFRCQQCFRHQYELRTKTNKKYKLHIHHIDYDKQNNNPNNLISLCRNCHLQTNFKRKDWQDYFKQKICLRSPKQN